MDWIQTYCCKRMDSHGEMGLVGGENYDPSLVGTMNEEGYESSDNFEGASPDYHDATDNGGLPNKRNKKYHRHTPYQIQGLESFFKACPHPDEKQRRELGARLGLEGKQIKFWFQNRRTQVKTQLERHENVILRQENDKLRAEHEMLKQAIASSICNNCGGQAVPGEICYEPNQLRMENARLKDELSRMCALTNKFLGGRLSSSANPSPSQGLNTNVELAVRRNGVCRLNNTGITLPMAFDYGGDGTMNMMMPLRKPFMAYEMLYDRSTLVDVALAAMDELIKMAQMGNPLWIKGLDDETETLNVEEYERIFPSCIGPKPNGYKTEATRATGQVFLRGLALVEPLMDADRWADMFPCIISRAETIDVLSSGTGATRDNSLQVMDAEFQVLSPSVPPRRVRFLRFCKQHSDGVWAVVDVSIDSSNAANCRRLPSGCVIQDMDNKYSKVTWVEHSEYDESTIHHLLRPLLNYGFGFGAQRWIATLQRQCDFLALLMSPDIHGEDSTGTTAIGRKNMLKLALRMTNNFISGVCASSVHKWDKLSDGDNVGDNVRVMTRKNVNDPGEPCGIVLSAATSVWMPIPEKKLFDFLRDRRMRGQWDILSNDEPMQAMINVAKGPGQGNCVTLLRGGATTVDESRMVILQETWSDASGSLIAYSPVDVSSISVVMNGGDTSQVPLLPSGFAILPGVSPGYHGAEVQSNSGGPLTKLDTNGDGSTTSGCLLTIGFQILVDSIPTAKLTVESVETVNHLLTCTVKKIKAALSVA